MGEKSPNLVTLVSLQSGHPNRPGIIGSSPGMFQDLPIHIAIHFLKMFSAVVFFNLGTTKAKIFYKI
jgi:hypothetical protein